MRCVCGGCFRGCRHHVVLVRHRTARGGLYTLGENARQVTGLPKLFRAVFLLASCVVSRKLSLSTFESCPLPNFPSPPLRASCFSQPNRLSPVRFSALRVRALLKAAARSLRKHVTSIPDGSSLTSCGPRTVMPTWGFSRAARGTSIWVSTKRALLSHAPHQAASQREAPYLRAL